ncbi:hypothetical protein [Lactobacillus melliventris]|nr:hypothetical protein [Lactobacillus melliventris]
MKFKDGKVAKMENKKNATQSDKIGTFKMAKNGELVWEDSI